MINLKLQGACAASIFDRDYVRILDAYGSRYNNDDGYGSSLCNFKMPESIKELMPVEDE